MRDRITHSYGDVDYKIVKNVLKRDLPDIKEKIESMVHEDVIRNPYMLYDQEYDDYVNMETSSLKKCMERTAERSPKVSLDQKRER